MSRDPTRREDLESDVTRRAEGTDPDVVSAETEASGDHPTFDPIIPGALGRFIVEREIGRGGMGRVLEARDPDLLRSVAIKILRSARASEVHVSRFLSEAQITGQLEHPNVVPVHELGHTDQGDPYLVLKMISGRSLREVLRAARAGEPSAREWTRHRLLSCFVQVCQAVAYAHGRGVLHRDLKPENVMLGEFGEVLVLDWGVAHVVAPNRQTGEPVERSSDARTVEGAVVGTTGYMSPEQMLGMVTDLDGRSDVWALGAILYEILTFQPAFPEERVKAVLAQMLRAPPPDPRAHAPDRRIPDEIAEICVTALAPDRDARIQSAAALAAAVEEFLEGSRRREQALGRVAQARTAWSEYVAAGDERDRLAARERRLAEATPSYTPLDGKAELLATRELLAAMEPKRARLFGEVVAHCEKALSHDPENAEAHAVLAEAYWMRLEDAERRRDAAGIGYYADRVAAHDDGRFAARLDGGGRLTLRTEPPGAVVVASRFDRSGLVWRLVEERTLGTTPIENLPLAMGSYLLELRSPGRPATRYPIFIRRGGAWSSGPAPVKLHTDAEIGDGFVYVPPGPFVCGGDPDASRALPLSEPWVDGFFIQVVPVTLEEYAAFLTEIHARDPDLAWSRVPRAEHGMRGVLHQYFERPPPGGAYRVPEQDADGDRWDPRWAVFGVSWVDCMAYADWCTRRDAIHYDLPLEREWEKATRGVDGRYFPWGDLFDPALCKMRDSRPGLPGPEPVGTFTTDVSVYGVRDLAGSKREFCSDPDFDGDTKQRILRGGAGVNDERNCRAAYRAGHSLHAGNTNYTFRLVRREPVPPPRG